MIPSATQLPPSLTERLAAALALVMAAAGIAAAAAATHLASGALLAPASQMLLAEAGLVLAALAARRTGLLAGRAIAILIAATLLGCLLFAADLSHRAFLETPLFARAAPTGGSLMILGWLCAGILAVFAGRKGGA